MQTSWIIWIGVIAGVVVFLFRFFTNPYFTGRVLRRVLHMRYKVTLEGFDELMKAERFLVMPNHPAYVDPVLFFAEMYARGRKVSPMTDEKFFRNPAFRQVLSLGDAVVVPDLMKNRSAEAVSQASRLTQIAVDGLAEGRSLVFYPSGHVTLDGQETIGNRRLAYETLSAIEASPADSPLRQVRIFLLRTRGLETSRWAKSRRKLLRNGTTQPDALPWSYKHPKWYQRREIRLHLEDQTDMLLRWAAENDKQGFNHLLEEWYNRPQGGNKTN